MLKMPDLTDADIAFPTRALEWMPPMEEIPKEFTGGLSTLRTSKWGRLVYELFFNIANQASLNLRPKAGVDAAKAWDVIRATLGSYSSKHEHKEACAAYMFSEWFQDCCYIHKDGTEVPWETE